MKACNTVHAIRVFFLCLTGACLLATSPAILAKTIKCVLSHPAEPSVRVDLAKSCTAGLLDRCTTWEFTPPAVAGGTFTLAMLDGFSNSSDAITAVLPKAAAIIITSVKLGRQELGAAGTKYRLIVELARSDVQNESFTVLLDADKVRPITKLMDAQQYKKWIAAIHPATGENFVVLGNMSENCKKD